MGAVPPGLYNFDGGPGQTSRWEIWADTWPDTSRGRGACVVGRESRRGKNETLFGFRLCPAIPVSFPWGGTPNKTGS